MKRLGVVGTLVYDRIWHPSRGGDEPLEQWGGIAYSLAALSAVVPPGWTVVPILRVGADLARSALDFIGSLPGVESGRSVAVRPEPNNRVELRYVDGANRQERLTGGVSPWDRSEIEPLLGELDALYVNFISGYEVDLDTALGFRELPVPTYADLHSLFLGPPLLRPRRPEVRLPCRPARWREWVSAFDAIQLNEAELALLTMGGVEEDAHLDQLPALGPALAVVTRGELGAEVVYDEAAGGVFDWPARRRGRRQGERRLRSVRAGLPGGAAGGDPTGCGDVWGSVAFMGLLRGLDLDAAMRTANAAAASRLGVGRIEELRDAVVAAVVPGGTEP